MIGPLAATLSCSDKESEFAVSERLDHCKVRSFLMKLYSATQEIPYFYGTRSLKIIFSEDIQPK